MSWEEYELDGKKCIGLACPNAKGVPGISGATGNPKEIADLKKNISVSRKSKKLRIKFERKTVSVYIELTSRGLRDALWLYFAPKLEREEITRIDKRVGIKLGILVVTIEGN